MNGTSLDVVNSFIGYCQKTGTFWWKPDCGHRMAGRPAGTLHKATGYITVVIKGRRFYAHRLAYWISKGSEPKCQIDHINGLRADNRIANLREATVAENGQNQVIGSRNTSGHLGVSRHGSGWRAYINVRTQRHVLGTFATKQQAAEAYATAKASLHLFNPTLRQQA